MQELIFRNISSLIELWNHGIYCLLILLILILWAPSGED